MGRPEPALPPSELGEQLIRERTVLHSQPYRHEIRDQSPFHVDFGVLILYESGTRTFWFTLLRIR